MSEKYILEGQGLRKEFGGLVAVADVNIRVRQGELHSIIGPNGAGKTTLFNLLTGNLRPTRGTVRFKDQDITLAPLYRRVHLGIGRSFQVTNIFPNLSVLENVRLAAQARGGDSFKFCPGDDHCMTTGMTSSKSVTGMNSISLRTDAGISSRSGSFSFGMMIFLMPCL